VVRSEGQLSRSSANEGSCERGEDMHMTSGGQWTKSLAEKPAYALPERLRRRAFDGACSRTC